MLPPLRVHAAITENVKSDAAGGSWEELWCLKVQQQNNPAKLDIGMWACHL